MKTGARSGTLLGALLIVGGFGLCSTAADEIPPHENETVHVVYRVYFSGVPVGEVTDLWTRTGASYRITSDAQPYQILRWGGAPTFNETSTGSVTSDYLLPSHFEHHRSDNAPTAMTDFHWDTGVLVHHIDDKTESMPLPPGAQDMLSIKYLYRVAGDAMLNRDIPMSTGKRLEVHHLMLAGEVDLDSPVGHFKTRHLVDQQQLQLQTESRLELWVARDRRYPPIRMHVTERGHDWEQRILRVEIE